MRMTLGPEAGKATEQRGTKLMEWMKEDGLIIASTWEKRSNISTWKEKELDYIVTGADMAPFIWEESNEQETEGLIAPSDHTAVMARFDMSSWGLKIQEMKEAAKSAGNEVTRIPANWKPEDITEFNRSLREELSKERATLTKIELIINDMAKKYAWKEKKRCFPRRRDESHIW